MTRAAALALLLVACAPRQGAAYSVLAHEATIDVAWDRAIRPLLRHRFPRTTDDALLRARSFAYGGSVIQDLGYYPFGNKFFSNLLHYVRSGDFVEALLRDARDVVEFSFDIVQTAGGAYLPAAYQSFIGFRVATPLLERAFRETYGLDMKDIFGDEERAI